MKWKDTFPIEIERQREFIFLIRKVRVFRYICWNWSYEFGALQSGLLETIKSKLERYMHVSNFLDEDTLIVSQQLVKFTEKMVVCILQILVLKRQKLH